MNLSKMVLIGTLLAAGSGLTAGAAQSADGGAVPGMSPAAWVDADDRVVGPAVAMPNDPYYYVLFRAKDWSALVHVVEGRDGHRLSAISQPYFNSADCTGPALVESGDQRVLSSMVAVRSADGHIQVARIGAPMSIPSTSRYISPMSQIYFDTAGSARCVAVPGVSAQSRFHPLSQVADLSAQFRMPIRLR